MAEQARTVAYATWVTEIGARGEGSPGQFRQRFPDLNGRATVAMLAVIAYTFAAFGVLWLVTGSTRVGADWYMSSLGDFLWWGPAVTVFVAVFVGDRGPLRIFYHRPVMVETDATQLAWTRAGRSGSIDWDQILSIEAGEAMLSSQRGVVVDSSRQITARLPMQLAEIDGPRRPSLVDLAVETRPDLFVRRGGWTTHAMAVRRSEVPSSSSGWRGSARDGAEDMDRGSDVDP